MLSIEMSNCFKIPFYFLFIKVLKDWKTFIHQRKDLQKAIGKWLDVYSFINFCPHYLHLHQFKPPSSDRSRGVNVFQNV